MSNVEEVRELIQQAAAEAAESGVAVIVEFIDKTASYDNFGKMKERLDIEIRVKVVPPTTQDNSVDIHSATAYSG